MKECFKSSLKKMCCSVKTMMRRFLRKITLLIFQTFTFQFLCFSCDDQVKVLFGCFLIEKKLDVTSLIVYSGFAHSVISKRMVALPHVISDIPLLVQGHITKIMIRAFFQLDRFELLTFFCETSLMLSVGMGLFSFF